MAALSRFACASSSLTLKTLLKGSKQVIWLCFAMGLAAHFSLSQVRGLQAEQKAAKPLTTQFVKRHPRLTKPLELKKKPLPKKRVMQRKMVAVKARAEQQEYAE